MMLSAESVDRYHRDGFLIVPDLFSPGEVRSLLERLHEYVDEKRPIPEGVVFQIEPIVQQGNAEARTRMERFRKVEGLARYDDRYRDLACDPRLLDLLRPVIGPDIKLFRDALMMKPPRHGSAKPYHQDSAYWSIDPPDLVSVWLALDDATLENGCMRVLRGSHVSGILEHRIIDDFQVDEASLDLTGEVAVPLRAGGCLLFHSKLLHATSPNESDRPRRAMITSYMSAKSCYTGEGAAPDFMTIAGRSYEDCV